MVQQITVPSEKSLPHNLEAERCVLGAILIHNDAFNVAAELVDADDFFREAHRRVFDKMVDLNERQQAIDFVTLKDELTRSGDLDDVGGPAYISALADGVPRSTNVEHYARIVKEKATLRNLIYSANKIAASAYSAEEDADAVIDQASAAHGRLVAALKQQLDWNGPQQAERFRALFDEAALVRVFREIDADGSGINTEGVSAAAELVVQLPASDIPGSDGTGSDTGPRMVHVGDTDPQQDGVTWIDANGCASDAS